MNDNDLGIFKVSVSPNGKEVALKLEMRSIDMLRRLVSRAQPKRTDDIRNFKYSRDMTLGALDMAMKELGSRRDKAVGL